MKLIGYTTATIFTLALSGLIKAYVGYKLYNWFALPIGAPLLSMGQLYGAIYFVTCMIHPWKGDKDAKDKEYSEILGTSFFTSIIIGAFALGFGYLLHAIIY